MVPLHGLGLHSSSGHCYTTRAAPDANDGFVALCAHMRTVSERITVAVVVVRQYTRLCINRYTAAVVWINSLVTTLAQSQNSHYRVILRTEEPYSNLGICIACLSSL